MYSVMDRSKPVKRPKRLQISAGQERHRRQRINVGFSRLYRLLPIYHSDNPLPSKTTLLQAAADLIVELTASSSARRVDELERQVAALQSIRRIDGGRVATETSPPPPCRRPVVATPSSASHRDVASIVPSPATSCATPAVTAAGGGVQQIFLLLPSESTSLQLPMFYRHPAATPVVPIAPKPAAPTSAALAAPTSTPAAAPCIPATAPSITAVATCIPTAAPSIPATAPSIPVAAPYKPAVPPSIPAVPPSTSAVGAVRLCSSSRDGREGDNALNTAASALSESELPSVSGGNLAAKSTTICSDDTVCLQTTCAVASPDTACSSDVYEADQGTSVPDNSMDHSSSVMRGVSSAIGSASSQLQRDRKVAHVNSSLQASTSGAKQKSRVTFLWGVSRLPRGDGGCRACPTRPVVFTKKSQLLPRTRPNARRTSAGQILESKKTCQFMRSKSAAVKTAKSSANGSSFVRGKDVNVLDASRKSSSSGKLIPAGEIPDDLLSQRSKFDELIGSSNPRAMLDEVSVTGCLSSTVNSAAASDSVFQESNQSTERVCENVEPVIPSDNFNIPSSVSTVKSSGQMFQSSAPRPTAQTVQAVNKHMPVTSTAHAVRTSQSVEFLAASAKSATSAQETLVNPTDCQLSASSQKRRDWVAASTLSLSYQPSFGCNPRAVASSNASSMAFCRTTFCNPALSRVAQLTSSTTGSDHVHQDLNPAPSRVAQLTSNTAGSDHDHQDCEPSTGSNSTSSTAASSLAVRASISESFSPSKRCYPVQSSSSVVPPTSLTSSVPEFSSRNDTAEYSSPYPSLTSIGLGKTTYLPHDPVTTFSSFILSNENARIPSSSYQHTSTLQHNVKPPSSDISVLASKSPKLTAPARSNEEQQQGYSISSTLGSTVSISSSVSSPSIQVPVACTVPRSYTHSGISLARSAPLLSTASLPTQSLSHHLPSVRNYQVASLSSSQYRAADFGRSISSKTVSNASMWTTAADGGQVEPSPAKWSYSESPSIITLDEDSGTTLAVLQPAKKLTLGGSPGRYDSLPTTSSVRVQNRSGAAINTVALPTFSASSGRVQTSPYRSDRSSARGSLISGGCYVTEMSSSSAVVATTRKSGFCIDVLCSKQATEVGRSVPPVTAAPAVRQPVSSMSVASNNVTHSGAISATSPASPRVSVARPARLIATSVVPCASVPVVVPNSETLHSTNAALIAPATVAAMGAATVPSARQNIVNYCPPAVSSVMVAAPRVQLLRASTSMAADKATLTSSVYSQSGRDVQQMQVAGSATVSSQNYSKEMSVQQLSSDVCSKSAPSAPPAVQSDAMFPRTSSWYHPMMEHHPHQNLQSHQQQQTSLQQQRFPPQNLQYDANTYTPRSQLVDALSYPLHNNAAAVGPGSGNRCYMQSRGPSSVAAATAGFYPCTAQVPNQTFYASSQPVYEPQYQPPPDQSAGYWGAVEGVAARLEYPTQLTTAVRGAAGRQMPQYYVPPAPPLYPRQEAVNKSYAKRNGKTTNHHQQQLQHPQFQPHQKSLQVATSQTLFSVHHLVNEAKRDDRKERHQKSEKRCHGGSTGRGAAKKSKPSSSYSAEALLATPLMEQRGGGASASTTSSAAMEDISDFCLPVVAACGPPTAGKDGKSPTRSSITGAATSSAAADSRRLEELLSASSLFDCASSLFPAVSAAIGGTTSAVIGGAVNTPPVDDAAACLLGPLFSRAAADPPSAAVRGIRDEPPTAAVGEVCWPTAAYTPVTLAAAALPSFNLSSLLPEIGHKNAVVAYSSSGIGSSVLAPRSQLFPGDLRNLTTPELPPFILATSAQQPGGPLPSFTSSSSIVYSKH